jgi:hypothetical protein
LARALEGLADVARGQKPPSEIECDIADVRKRIIYEVDDERPRVVIPIAHGSGIYRCL